MPNQNNHSGYLYQIISSVYIKKLSLNKNIAELPKIKEVQINLIITKSDNVIIRNGTLISSGRDQTG
jgi:hypothetical protein